jgi:hypothetical protein
MEGVLFIPPDRARRVPELTCTSCGELFRPHGIAEGAEELCDRCYEAQFRPVRLRNARPRGRHPGSATVKGFALVVRPDPGTLEPFSRQS